MVTETRGVNVFESLFVVLAAVMMLVFAGCSTGGGAPRGGPNPAWSGPGFDASINVMESAPPQYAVRYSATVPTGGWEMQTDEVRLIEGVLTLRVTLIKPDRNTMVTQALETLRDQYLAGTARVDVVNIFARQHERGSEPPRDYTLAHTVSQR